MKKKKKITKRTTTTMTQTFYERLYLRLVYDNGNTAVVDDVISRHVMVMMMMIMVIFVMDIF